MNFRAQQNGATLVTALVMLVVLTMLVISAIRSSTTNLRIAGNMQLQEEAIAAAQQATETVISNNFTANPTTTTVDVDVNNDGNADYTATVLAPKCTNSTPLSTSAANLPKGCYSSGAYDPNRTSGLSDCLAQQWDVNTTVTDKAATGAVQAGIHQGVTLTVSKEISCP